MKLFDNGKVRIEKDSLCTFNGLPLFEVWELKTGRLGDLAWHYAGKFAAINYKKAYEKYTQSF